MALNAKLNKEAHAALSEELQKEYKELDGSFILDVTPIDGMALENVTGLKSTVERLRQSEKDLTASVKATNQSLEAEKAKYAGIDPTQARDLLNKVNDIKNWKGEEKIAEAVKATEAKHTTLLEQLNSKHTELVNQLTEKVTKTESQLREEIVTSKISSAILTHEGNVQLLLPHVKSQVRMITDSSGKFIPEVIHDNGTPRIGDNQGNPMTIDQLVQEMKAKETFAGAFAGVNSTGSGHKGSSNNTGHKPVTKPDKEVNATDQRAMSNNLESIASGKVSVNMKTLDE